MLIRDELNYPATPTAVATMLADHDFVVAKCEAMEASDVQVTVEGDPSGAFTVTSTRTQSTEQIPESVRKFAGDGLQLRQVDTWQAPSTTGTRVGTVDVEIIGFPVRFTATMALEAVSGGCSQSVEGNLKASIPLFGSKVEQAAAPAIAGAIRTEHRTGTAWLAAHPS